ncbi:MAG: YdbH domain-containing protein [Pseudomonadota bacterium]
MLKTLKFISQAIVFLLFLGLAGYVLLPVALRYYLEQQSGTTIQNLSINPKKLSLEKIAFNHGQTQITVEKITVHFSLRGLKNKKIRAILIEGINGLLSLHTDAKSPAISLQTLKEKLRWGFIPVKIKNAQLTIDHPIEGLLPLSFKGKIRFVDVKDHLETWADIDFIFQENQYVKQASGTFSSHPGLATGLPNELKGSLQATHLKFLETPAPINGQFSFHHFLGSQKPLTFKGILLTHQDKKLLSFTGEHRFPNVGFAEIKSQPLNFGSSGLKLADYWEGLPKKLKHIEGNVSAQGKISWQAGKITQEIDLNIAQGSAKFDDIKISGLKTQLKLLSLKPIQTAPHQRIFIERIETAVPLEKIQYAITIDPKVTRIHQVTARINSGQLLASNIILDPLPSSQDIDIILERISLAKFFQLLNIGGLTAKGHISGKLPVIWHADRSLGIKSTQLKAQGKGYISYKSLNGLPQNDASLKLVAELFQDFQYESLRILLEKPAGGDLRATLDILGKNPKVRKGRLVRLRLNISGKLMSLLETIWMSLTWDLEGLRLESIQRQRKGR